MHIDERPVSDKDGFGFFWLIGCEHGGKLIVIQDVQQVRAIGQKVDEQGEQDGEGEEFHVREIIR
jgi:hypothetical protein